MSKSLADVIVATCDNEIASVVRSFGGKVIMTANTHKNGTTRVAEAIKEIDCSHVILLQGDEPLLLPRHIDFLVKAIMANPDGDAWNATGPIEDPDELDRKSFVKCAVDANNWIMFCFRRSPSYSDFDTQKIFIRKILGIIAYQKDFLIQLTSLPPSLFERAEFIEQMRIIENGYLIQSVPVIPSLPSVNEKHEAQIILDYINQCSEQTALLRNVLAFKKI
jgi:3-deoxy-manno-octulosonate cytidylyltransferase (CMP-KDO synthetase)